MNKVTVKTADGRTAKPGRESLKAPGSDAVTLAVKAAKARCHPLKLLK